uniref:Uncharacterized protein n=1 Tax=Nelumbo nucifera TaxID=4432 RepID=A0A822YCC2_NELNU|nr:TPA_asm: hypothetical protein HUJ06_031430 [Nelumbo nucifera]
MYLRCTYLHLYCFQTEPKEKLLQQVVASWLGKKSQLLGTYAAEKALVCSRVEEAT